MKSNELITLIGPAYFSISKGLGLGEVGVLNLILFGKDLLWDNLLYSKVLMKLGCLKPSKKMFDF